MTPIETKAAAGTTLARAIFPGRLHAQPRLTYGAFAGDDATSTLSAFFGRSRHETTADAADDATALVLDSVEGLDDDDRLIVQPRDGSAPFLVTIDEAGVDAETKTVTLTGAVGVDLSAGAEVFALDAAANAAIPVGAATKELGGGDMSSAPIAGRHGMPMALELTGDSACDFTATVGWAA